MYEVIYKFKATENFEDFSNAILEATDETAEEWGWDSEEKIEKAIREGWLEFTADGYCKIYAEFN